jgi:hypothetical protein
VATVEYHQSVPRPRKRPEGERPTRLTIEVYEPDADLLLRQMRAAAALRGEPVREWLLRAIRAQLEREAPPDPPERGPNERRGTFTSGRSPGTPG